MSVSSFDLHFLLPFSMHVFISVHALLLLLFLDSIHHRNKKGNQKEHQLSPLKRITSTLASACAVFIAFSQRKER